MIDISIYSTFVAVGNAEKCFDETTSALHKGIVGNEVDLWVAGGVQYSQCAREVIASAKWPTLKVLLLGAGESGHNLASAIVSSYALRFLQGYLCAIASSTNAIGFVATAPRTSPSIFRALTAFALGAKRAKPNITVSAVLTSTFDSPVAGRKAATMLVEKANVGCISSQLNDLTVLNWATKYHRYALGLGTDARFFVNEYVLLSLLYNWTVAVFPYYEHVLSDTWELAPPTFAANLSVRGITASAYSTLVTEEWSYKVDDMEAQLLNNSVRIFCTPWWTDPQFMTPENTEEVSPGVRCMTGDAIGLMVGVPDVVDVIEEYHARNSPYRFVWISNTYAGSIAAYILASLLIIWAIGVGIHVLIFRRESVYSAASPLFLLLILLGTILITSSIYFRIGKHTSLTCMASWWVFGIGFALLFSCVSAKNWRIWRIFTSSRLKQREILDIHLLTRWVVTYLVLEIAMLLVWTFVDPLVPTYSRSPLLEYDEVQVVCQSQTKIGLFYVYLVFNLLLLVPTGIIAFIGRTGMANYDETGPIGAIVYIMVITEVVIFLVNFAIQPHYKTTFWLYSGAAWLASLFMLAIFFTPKMVRLHYARNAPAAPDDGAVELSGFQSIDGRNGYIGTASMSRNGGRSIRTPNNSLRGAEVEVEEVEDRNEEAEQPPQN